MPLAGLSYDPSYEYREAARWAGSGWGDFCALDTDEQSAIVAHFQTSRQIDAVLAQDAEQRRARLAARARRRKG